MKKNLKACILTLGCRVNQYESDAIMQELSESGVQICESTEDCDIYIINTCTVTAESDRKSRQFIRRCASKNPNAVVIVTGCYSQINPKETLEIEGVDFVCGNNAKSIIAKKALELISKKEDKSIYIPDIYNSKFDSMQVGAPLTRTRAFIKIEDGCESKCAYCIIPQARGSVRSESKENIVKEVEKIVSQGCYEVVLTGIETSAYGKDFDNNYSLSDLLCDINKIEGLKRIRLGSLDPVSINKEFTDKIKGLDKVMPHFHISMQSGCTRVLNLMRRKYNIDMAKANIEYMKSQISDVNFSADVITGFPGETDEDFLDTLEFFKEQRFMRIHIFPYSKRKGTVAYDMPNQVEEGVKKQRLKLLSSLEEQIRLEIHNDFIKSHDTVSVLFESFDGEYSYGHTPNFIEVKIKTPCRMSGEFHNVTPTSCDKNYIYAELNEKIPK